ncbi:MAG: hypothetical protein AAFX54_04010 [Pseudomonadota bacterium]
MPTDDRDFQSETDDGLLASKIQMGLFNACDKGMTAVSFSPLEYILAPKRFWLLFRFIPRTATQTDVELLWLVDENATPNEDYSVEILFWLWDLTVRQSKKSLKTIPRESNLRDTHLVRIHVRKRAYALLLGGI